MFIEGLSCAQYIYLIDFSQYHSELGIIIISVLNMEK